VRWLLLALYVGLIFAANWAVDRWGIVPVGLGLMAPAAVYVVGLTFVVRDLLQRVGGRALAIVAIPIGAGLSALVSPELALASGCAFLASETVDMAIYTALERRLVLAILVSGAVALVVDSVLFLWLAFGSLDFLPGQLWGKAVATLVGAALIFAARAFLARRSPPALVG
jgi:uncharacterized PurR-regulated membrane protein YhhQ (DUF165 family)